MPDDTTLSDLLARHGGPGVVFRPWTVEGVFEAIERALGSFDDLAGRASAAAKGWTDRHGPARLLDALLADAPTAASRRE